MALLKPAFIKRAADRDWEQMNWFFGTLRVVNVVRVDSGQKNHPGSFRSVFLEGIL
jgi:hypothetical protein